MECNFNYAVEEVNINIIHLLDLEYWGMSMQQSNPCPTSSLIHSPDTEICELG